MKKSLCMFAALFVIPWLTIAGQSSAGEEEASSGSISYAQRPQAQSEQEREDYLAASSATTGATLQAAAEDFAARYPESKLRVYLYAQTMQQYQVENNAPRLLAMADKVLALDPNHSVALALSATVLADNLQAGDRDREHEIQEIRRNASRAIYGSDKGFIAPASATLEEVALYRSAIRSMAYSALGIMKLKTGDDAGAEKDLITALALNKLRPDPYLWYHLALAQDHRRHYSAALNSVEQALQLASSNPHLQKLAEIEHERLSGLAGRAPRSGGGAQRQ
jgi:tetratricopeptide (TPR) repeat protein